MQVADDDDVTDVAGADAEVSGEQRVRMHVHQSSYTHQSVAHLRSWAATSQQRLRHVASRSVYGRKQLIWNSEYRVLHKTGSELEDGDEDFAA